MHLVLASVVYVAGFTNFTKLVLAGRTQGDELQLEVSLYPDPSTHGYAIPVGVYEGLSGRIVLRDRDGLCEDHELWNVAVTIHEHVPGVFETGGGTLLTGTVGIHDNGWALELPFEIGVVCRAVVDT